MPQRMETHERGAHERRAEPEPGPGGSDRGFGFVMAVLFAVVASFPLLRGAPPRSWALAAAAGFLLFALLRPGWLAPLHRVWFRLGLLLQRLVQPVVLAAIYFGVVTPIGLLMRAFGKDPLALRFDPEAPSYWIHRDPPGPDPESLRRQF